MKKNETTNRIWFFLALALTWFCVSNVFAQGDQLKVSITKSKVQTNREKTVKIDDEVENDTSMRRTSGKRESETTTVTVTLKNAGAEPVTGQLEWAFISDHSSGKQDPKDREKPAEAERTVFSPGKKTITLDAGQTVEETIVSQPFIYEEKTVETERYNDTNNGSSVRDSEEGNIYKGYLVLFTVNGQVISKKANSSSYTKPNWVALCQNPPAPPRKGKKKKNK